MLFITVLISINIAEVAENLPVPYHGGTKAQTHRVFLHRQSSQSMKECNQFALSPARRTVRAASELKASAELGGAMQCYSEAYR